MMHREFDRAKFSIAQISTWLMLAAIGCASPALGQNAGGERYPLSSILRHEFQQQDPLPTVPSQPLPAPQPVPAPQTPPAPQPRAQPHPPQQQPQPVPRVEPSPRFNPSPLPPVAPEELPPAPPAFREGPPLAAPLTEHESIRIESNWNGNDFAPDPISDSLSFDPLEERDPYESKSPVVTQRPWVEWGRSFYAPGQLSPSELWLGRTNPVAQQFLVYGDYRAALATRKFNGVENNQIANRLNLELDWKFTSTGRLHSSLQPLNRQGNFTRVEFDSQDADFIQAFNANPVTGYLEADLGAFWGGLTGHVLPFEMPIAVGAMPLLFQNGVWFDDNVIGAAVTLPARNSSVLDIPNYDITFFYLFDNITSPAFANDGNAAKAYGVAMFLDAYGGYVELDYGYLEDRSSLDRSYHNVAAAYTRRYGSWLSNSVRVVGNVGQDPEGIANTADGLILLMENSLVTSNPYLVVPYANFFAGFRRPQSFARNAAAGGILRNTGILFESDNLTGYPTLDSSGNEAWGGALGINLIPATINRQLVMEYAFVQVMDDVAFRKAAGNQQGLGMRYQQNLSNAWLFRADAMYGFLDNADDISGARMELRHKF